MWSFYLTPDEVYDISEMNYERKNLERALRHLNKKDMLYNHNVIMLNRLIYQLKMEVKVVKLHARERLYKRIRIKLGMWKDE